MDLFKVRLLEHNSNGAGTWLYRTNLPIINGTFAADTLLYCEISKYLHIEENFFKQNPDIGEFHNWPIVGSVVSPNWLSEDERRREVAALNASIDDLPLRIPLIHSWIYPE